MKWRQVMSVICLLLGLTGVIWADMNDDPEAQELLASFRAMQETSRYLDDSFDGETQGTITGPVSFGPGVNANKNETDKAALFPETKEAAVYIYYGPYVPLRGRFSLDFKVDHFPPRSSRIGLFNIGTAGNSTTRLKVGLDGVVYADMSTKRGVVELFSDALDLSKWHYVEWWYGPEGSIRLQHKQRVLSGRYAVLAR